MPGNWPKNLVSWSGAGTGTGETIEVTFGSEGTKTLEVRFDNGKIARTTINVIKPVPDTVSFEDSDGDYEHDIAYVTDPVWRHVSNPDNPASYTEGKKVKALGRFWAAEELTFPTGVLVYASGPPGGYGMAGATFQAWPSPETGHVSGAALANNVGVTEGSLTWRYFVLSGSGEWVDMGTSGPHKLYRVFGPPRCGPSNYTKDNIANAVQKAAGSGPGESAIASKANDTVASNVSRDGPDNCICLEGFQVNFDAAMGVFPPPPPDGKRGMCCCRAEGLSCVLQVLGIGPYGHDFVNEWPEPNYGKMVYIASCTVCGDDFDRCYWDGFWNNWEGVVKAGGNGSTCYAPANGSISIDEGTYGEIDARIAVDCGYYWRSGPSFTDRCPHLPPPP